MKRKNDEPQHVGANGSNTKKKRAISDREAISNFRSGLFDAQILKDYTDQYAASQPYKHAVISDLIKDDLLRAVRTEIKENLHFTPKETDIYKIHQSGDLANLDGLDDASLDKLPSLLKLRDALYSSAFRRYVSQVADAGPLSGKKTDMAINIYTPGSHLLCHDDVIGSRRVSYILYLTDPDKPWRAEWGGALRLYPTEKFTDKQKGEVKVPTADFTVSIPPAWNQLAFFAVQPGESFHDVEEVYKRAESEPGEDVDGGRVRMAISGWYHIPQEGEEGYVEGLEEKLAEQSSLTQLQNKADTFDLPQAQWLQHEEEGDKEDKENGKPAEDDEEPEMTEEDLEFLLQYMTPHYLAPDTVDELNSQFEAEPALRIANFLSPKFAQKLRSAIEEAEKDGKSASEDWEVARPPHKHRFMYQQLDYGQALNIASDPIRGVTHLLQSSSFKKWLSLATGCTLAQCNVLARRFRRGMDYTLATSYNEEDPQLEVTLGITPTSGWGEDEQTEDAPKQSTNGKGKAQEPKEEEEDVGGYEMYMAGDDDEGDESDAGSDHGVTIPSGSKNTSKPSAHTGAGNRRDAARRKKADPAIYKASTDEDEDGVLFSMPAGWNNMSIVLRDEGTLKFLKYVSKAAKGDRWDVTGEWKVSGSWGAEDEEDEE